jgi:hypothetical protein
MARRHSTIAGMLLAGLLLAGCGGGDQTATRTGTARSADSPADTADAAGRRLRHFFATRDCTRIRELAHPLYRYDVKSCRSLLAAEPPVSEGRPFVARRFGTGATVLLGGGLEVALAIDATKRFKMFTTFNSPPTTQRPDRHADQTASSAIQAIARGDCNRLYRVSAIPDPNGMAARKLCARPTLRPVRAALQQYPTARPHRLGGDGAFAFYALRAGTEYFTVVLVGGRGYGFVDAFPAQ